MAKVLWVQKQDIGPLPRVGHSMAFDAGRKRVVLFGGDSLAGTLFGDTWEWDGDNWTQVQDIGPSPRKFHAAAYDSARSRVVLFGGWNGILFNDTWEWDGSDWTQVEDSGPAKRFEHSMAYDASRQCAVLFGGQIGTGPYLNDTWEWDGAEWVQQADTGPSVRSLAAMSYDSIRKRTVLFGGLAGTAGAPLVLGDTWEWDGTTWTEESNFGPDPCLAATMVFNGARSALYGGIQFRAGKSPPEVFSRSWEWDGKHWTARQDMGPGPRAFHGAAYDSARSRIVLFGGASAPISPTPPASDIFGDTWEQFQTGPSSSGGGSRIVEFLIPPGTLSVVWNTAASIVVASVGDTLRIVNNDAVNHRPHTDGAPFPHPTSDIAPGTSADYVLLSPYDPVNSGPLYDHDFGRPSEFWIRVVA